jgi:hypothetical protein
MINIKIKNSETLPMDLGRYPYWQFIQGNNIG